jgi:hypothetical protein
MADCLLGARCAERSPYSEFSLSVIYEMDCTPWQSKLLVQGECYVCCERWFLLPLWRKDRIGRSAFNGK